MIALDFGRAANGGKPPAELHFTDARIPNPRRTQRRRRSSVPTKRRGSRTASANQQRHGRSGAIRSARWICAPIPQNLPDGLTEKSWPDGHLRHPGSDDYGSACVERKEIYDLVRDAKITGFAIVSGDRHSFWAGYAAALLPPGKFEPVGLSFVGGSLVSPGPWKATNMGSRRTIRSALYLAYRPGAAKPDWTYNMLLSTEFARPSICEVFRHGPRESALESGPRAPPRILRRGRARLCDGPPDRRRNAHRVRLYPAADHAQRKPGRRAAAISGRHTAKLWAPGERPRLVQQVLEGDPGLSIYLAALGHQVRHRPARGPCSCSCAP